MVKILAPRVHYLGRYWCSQIEEFSGGKTANERKFTFFVEFLKPSGPRSI